MDVEAQTGENTKSIAALALTVTELATAVKYESEIAKNDRSSVKEMVVELKALNQKISDMAGVQKEQAQVGKDVAELRTRVDQLKEWKDKFDLSNMQTRIEGLEKQNTKEAGVKEAVTTGAEWFWKIFGPAVTAVTVAACAWYFSEGRITYKHTEETYQGKGHGQITGN